MNIVNQKKLWFFFLLASCSSLTFAPKAPMAPRQLSVLKAHGQERQDWYFWLKDKNNPATLDYLQQENLYTDKVLAPYQSLTQDLYLEMRSRIVESDQGVAYLKEGYYYSDKIEEGQEYRDIYRSQKEGELGQLFIDVNNLSKGKEYFDLVWSVSPGSRYLALLVDDKGDELYQVSFKDLKNNLFLQESLQQVDYQLEWSKDGRFVFYIKLDESLRPYQVYAHELASPSVKADQLIYEEKDPEFRLSLGKSKNNKQVIINSQSSNSNEILLIEEKKSALLTEVLFPRLKDVEYDVEEIKEKLFVLTNYQAKNFRLLLTSLEHSKGLSLEKVNFQEIIPQQENALLQSFVEFKDHLVLKLRGEGASQIKLLNKKSYQLEEVQFIDPNASIGLIDNEEYGAKFVRMYFQSLVIPETTIDYYFKSKKQEIKKVRRVAGGYKSDLYESQKIMVPSHDGKKIPLSLVYRKDLLRPKAPLYLEGYGAYGLSFDTSFKSSRLSLLDRGFIYAIAHIRGGQEMGRGWYDEGKLKNKKNTFKDFITVAEYLIQNNYTQADKLVISGASAGGLLMGAVINQRPDLFKVVLADVPFVDTLTTMLDDSLPLTTNEYGEWGNPQMKEDYETIASYSPYDNVLPQAYPNILVRASLNDSRVSYWEPAKWVAKMRYLKTNDSEILLKTNMGAGHFGPTGRYRYLEDLAFDYTFIFRHIFDLRPPFILKSHHSESAR